MKNYLYKHFNTRIKYVYIGLIAIFFFVLGILFAKVSTGSQRIFSSASASNSPTNVPAILEEVKNALDNNFIPWKASTTLPTEKDLEYGMVKGYVESYKDPYTQFFTPTESKQFEENIQGSFGGIGAYIGYKDSNPVIISNIKGSPAEKAGIKAGDIILSVNGTSSTGMPTDQIVALVRGEIGTDVTLEVIHKGDTKTSKIKITRQVISIPVLDTETKGDVFIIHFYSFTEDSADKFQTALQEFVKTGKSKLIIDLRGNGGGYLDAAVNIASFFLTSDKIVVTEQNSKNGGDQKDYSKGFNYFNGNLKLAVLIDGGSASASEILAGALKDNGVATVIGEKSFGKGCVQQLIKLSDGSDIKVTVAKWFTPKGINISENGITPDIVASSSQTTKTDKNGKTIDTQLLKAVDIVSKLK